MNLPGNPVYENLKSMTRILGVFPPARYLDEYPGLVLYDGGVNDAYENYALYDPAHIYAGKLYGEFENSAKFGLDFFARQRRPHIWPLFHGTPNEAWNVLERLGVERSEDFYAMSADTAGIEQSRNFGDFNIRGPLSGETETRAWAEVAWRGFGSDDGPPEPFIAFARGMAEHSAFSLFHTAGRATGMLFAGGETCGIYYISTLPEFRGRGLAGAMVNRLKARAAELGFGKAVLLATPSGRPLYLKHGFTELATVMIYRSE